MSNKRLRKKRKKEKYETYDIQPKEPNIVVIEKYRYSIEDELVHVIEIDKMITERVELVSQIKKLKLENNNLLEKYIAEQSKKFKVDNENIKIKEEYKSSSIQYDEWILSILEKEEDSLRSNLENIDKIEKLEKELTNITMKYNSLRNSKLGKITLKYWDVMRKKRR